MLSSIKCCEFQVRVDAYDDDLHAIANTETDWGKAWEKGLEPIKQDALRGMRRDIWNMDANLAEDNYSFQAAMVLLASEMLGPYVDRIATFVGYPRGLVQVIAIRLKEAKIWEVDEVRCENWFDPRKGGAAFLMDQMVAEGTLTRRWSEEKKDYVYHLSDVAPTSQFAI